MQKEDLYNWIENPENLDTSTLEELKKVVEEYPYFHSTRLLYVKNLHLTNNPDYAEELGKTAILCNDRRKLFYLIYREEYKNFLETDKKDHLDKADRTEELLESFLSSLGEKEVFEPTIENTELNLATIDYFSYLKSLGGEEESPVQTESQQLQHQNIIDAFIEKAESDILFVPNSTTPPQTEEVNVKEDGGEFLTETLAKIYIKQKKYEQALTIIKRLSLNFPKKSVYFAHQIRFLELLISIERSNQPK